jgi:NADPH:quinone reductase-like Zn-dependent oxidoreductase
VIERVGPAVDPSRVGERVWIWNGQWKRPFGTAATYIALPSEQALRLPDGTTFEAGACLGRRSVMAARRNCLTLALVVARLRCQQTAVTVAVGRLGTWYVDGLPPEYPGGARPTR